jgi:dynein light chain LC8-type|tara:strand:+ start:117 stop:404 length:288 start_codon:yes stop_codon:yes gene_type:complete
MEGGADSGDNKMISDMDEHGTMRKDVAGFADSAISQWSSEWEIAKCIKESLDKKYGPCWHCIVGQEFRMHCSHVSKTFMFFYVGKMAICVYQTEY